MVGTVMSTMHLLRLVKEPEDVAREAEEGRMMCRPVWSEIEILEACEKLGERIGPRGARAISSL